MVDLGDVQNRLESWWAEHSVSDSAHDVAHARRVWRLCERFAAEVGGKSDVLLPAAYLHDCVSIPKDDPLRRKASTFAVTKASGILRSMSYPKETIFEVEHAIKAHSYSAGIQPRTVEAMILRDADRLEALGAIGVARCIAVGTSLGRPLFDPEDPLAERRRLDDGRWTLDHFFTKLLNLPERMLTEPGRREAERRALFVREFADRIAEEAAT